MKRIASSALVVILIGFAMFAQPKQGQSKQSGPPTLGDNAGNMSVSGFSSWRVEKDKTREGYYRFLVRTSSGKRITGKWVKQSIFVDAGELEGLINVQADGAKMLISASMRGQISADFSRPSTNKGSQEKQTVHVEADAANYTASRNEVDVKGGLTLERKDPGSGESMIATGSSGVITLSDLTATSNAIKLAVLNGPVVLKMNGARRGKEGKSEPYNLSGSANKVVFNDAARTIVFTGDVKISGDDPGIGGEISGVHTATVTLAASGEVESIDLEGDPGKTVISDKKKGGGRR